ncbi:MULTISPECIES: restriction endonuclease subunit S [unclassified Halomonas]|uniref:restriction endonuclease subunit S n=1 Tax=unclassified Halomonas TaxID=2609666 RepID=UPI002076B67B|nr:MULTISPECIES: restriction endonuclease subunit S [unclassified Halomonas]
MIEGKPKEWSRANIGTLCNLINGRAFKSSEWSETGLPIIRIQNLNNPEAKYNYFDGELNEKHRIESGDLLFAWSGTPGTSFGAHVWRGESAALNQHIFKIEFERSLIEKRFLLYAINQTLDVLISGAHGGVGLRHVTKGKFEAAEISFPSLAEQKVIADTLDTLLAQVDNTKARLERIPEILKRFRQSVLAAAVSGRLTEEWNKKYTAHDEWQKISLGHLIENGPQNGIYKPIKLYGSGCLIIRIDSFYDGLIADWEKLKRVQLSPSEIKKWQVHKEDILINRVNSIEYLGKSALVKDLLEPAVFESNVMRLSLKRGLANPEFISLFLRSPVGLEQLRANAKLAVNQASINQNDVKSCLLALPSLEEQAEIVRRVDQLFAYADTVERQVNSALARVNQLTQSILAKAFRGELTTQWRADNVDLISGDNSAEALLARIKAERAAQAPKKRTRKKAAP